MILPCLVRYVMQICISMSETSCVGYIYYTYFTKFMYNGLSNHLMSHGNVDIIATKFCHINFL
jgi:hypothetical protein